MCDTIAINKKFSETMQTILAKNSDRPLGECQPLGYFPAGTKREKPSCVKSTSKKMTATVNGTGYCKEGSRFAVIGSRPYWMDGFEMGANEKGLFIGNEAEGSKCPAETVEGLLGMDMLRCALEAAETAREAVGVITGLLETFGQNANASQLFDRRYENTFIMCDQKEVWILETAGRQWVSKKIDDYATVSNCYTITTDWTECSKDMEKTVRDNRWLHPSEPVDFAKAYTKPATRQRFSVPRRNQMMKLLFGCLLQSMNEIAQKRLEDDIEDGKFHDDRELNKALKSYGASVGVPMLKFILGDHFEDEINAGRFSDSGGENCSICMHANSWDEAKTAASMIMTYEKGIGLKLLWAPASPCMSVYIPVYWIPGQVPKIPECMSRGSEKFDDESLWWHMEWAGQLTGIDEEVYSEDNSNDLLEVELNQEDAQERIEKLARKLVKDGMEKEAQELLNEFTENYALKAMLAAGDINDYMIKEIQADGGFYGPRKEFLKDYAERVSLFENIVLS